MLAPPPRFPLLLSGLLGLLGACGFGDDRRFGGDVDAAEVDAATIDATPIDAPRVAKVFEVMPLQPIPDNTPAGYAVGFAVTEVATTSGLDVQVDVTHPYRGDIRIELRRGTTLLKILKAVAGADSVDNIQATYPVSPTELGTPINSAYTVLFVDAISPDVGTINLVRLTFKPN
jgi:serine protease